MPSHLCGQYILPSNNSNSATNSNSSNKINANDNNTSTSSNHGTMPNMMANNRQMSAQFVRDGQNQQSIRLNPMMAPSMPNIAHSSGYATNMTASQSMQNVNMIHPNYYGQPMQTVQSNQLMNAAFPNGYNPELSKSQENAAQTLDMAEMARRRQQRQQDMMPMYSLDVNVHNSQNSMPNLSSGSMLLSPNGQNQGDLTNSFRANATMTKGHSSHPGINYSHNAQQMNPGMVKQFPPTAPKPQVCTPSISFLFRFYLSM